MDSNMTHLGAIERKRSMDKDRENGETETVVTRDNAQ